MYNLLDISDPRWMLFLENKKSALIFHHPAWIRMICETYHLDSLIVALLDNQGHIVAGLPAVIMNRPIMGKRLVSLPFTDFCQPLSNTEADLERLTIGLACLYRDQKMKQFEVRWTLPRQPQIHPSCTHVLHQVELTDDFDKLSQGFHRMHRRNSRKARGKGVRIEWGNQEKHIRVFYDLHLQTRKRQGVPVQPRRFFNLLGEQLIAKGLGTVLLAYHGKQCLAGAVFLYWNQTLIYKYGASRLEGLRLRPNNLIFWEAIEWGCKNGYRLFDMGRSEIGNLGLRAFKNGWGARETPLTYSCLSPVLPQRSPERLILWGGGVIKHAPLWVCRLLGEILYRYAA